MFQPGRVNVLWTLNRLKFEYKFLFCSKEDGNEINCHEFPESVTMFLRGKSYSKQSQRFVFVVKS